MSEMTLGKRIAALRRACGMTQEVLAEALGVSGQAVSKWENDLTCPDILLLPKLADLLHVTVDTLLRSETEAQTRFVEPARRKRMEEMILKLRVRSCAGDRVSLNVPLPVIKLGIGLGSIDVGGINLEQTMSNVSVDDILRMVDVGIMGKLMEFDSSEGDHGEIWVE